MGALASICGLVFAACAPAAHPITVGHVVGDEVLIGSRAPRVGMTCVERESNDTAAKVQISASGRAPKSGTLVTHEYRQVRARVDEVAGASATRLSVQLVDAEGFSVVDGTKKVMPRPPTIGGYFDVTRGTGGWRVRNLSGGALPPALAALAFPVDAYTASQSVRATIGQVSFDIGRALAERVARSVAKSGIDVDQVEAKITKVVPVGGRDSAVIDYRFRAHSETRQKYFDMEVRGEMVVRVDDGQLLRSEVSGPLKYAERSDDGGHTETFGELRLIISRDCD